MENSKKIGRYERVAEQLKLLLDKTDDPVSRMATINAVLHHKMDGFFWTGFYLLKEGELLVGPYQGSIACQILTKDKGVCWTSINQKKIIVVDNVENFPGHIACDARSKSEIAVPLKNKKGEVVGVFDIDSNRENCFDQIDSKYLEVIANMVYVCCPDKLSI